MKYSDLCKVYEELEKTTKGLEKTSILSKFLEKIENEPEIIYLLQGRIFPDYNNQELGISTQLVIKAIARATGIEEPEVIKEFKKLGDLGKVAEFLINKKRQSTLFSKNLTTEKILANLKKIPELEGKGTIDKKLALIIELLNSARGEEAKYIIKTILSDLKIGVGSGLIRDAIVDYCYHPKSIEEKKAGIEKVQEAYDITTDFAEVFNKTCKNSLSSISLSPGKPVKVMLFPKAENIDNAFEIVGKPAAFEYKYDGFRMMINKQDNGEIKIFTRRLENVTKQFPDAVKYIKENIKGKSFILDAEAVGYSPITKEYRAFQDISQRIKRKYNINILEKELPIELNIFDIIYFEGSSLISTPFKKRRELIEKIIKPSPFKIKLAEQIITADEKEAEEFYEKALEEGQEGLMAKNLEAGYKPGARVGHAVKLKPDAEELDLVITGAEYGTGKRAGWLTSYDVSCKNNASLLEIGKVSTGLKEKQEQGLSFIDLTNELKKIIIKEEGKHLFVKPEIVITVGYQNIQKSPSYSSGYALRFPRVKALRPDRSISDIATLKEVEKEFIKQQK
ncbi:ATP-dependent DNA ligase [Candidatus Pacearchaeota archaeon]|nr:ATP-dependent DNA ligase [Candidatus Pacearchaeota archaeon]